MNKVHLADCMDIMRKMPDKSVDLCIVDPPYGIGMDNSNKRTKPSRPNSYTDYPDFRYHEADWDKSRPSKEYFDELFRISVRQIIWGANYMCDLLPSGFGWIFWNKLNGNDNCFSDGEFAFASKGVQSRYFSCSQFDGLKGGKERIHPTQKPVALYKWLLKNYAKPGDKIFDSHVGSGSIRIACHDMGFDFEGCEIDKDYWEAQEKRYNQHAMQGELFSSEDTQKAIYQGGLF
jgi:site-specific DNA-methyltransferase (adenine-specific)